MATLLLYVGGLRIREKLFQISVSFFIPGYPSLCLRGAGLAATSLQDLTRVGEGEGGAGSLGNSWTAKLATAMRIRVPIPTILTPCMVDIANLRYCSYLTRFR